METSSKLEGGGRINIKQTNNNKKTQPWPHFFSGEIFATKRPGMESKMFHFASHYYLDTNYVQILDNAAYDLSQRK